MKIKKFFVFFLLAFVALALVACTGDEDVDKKINEFLDQVAITYAAGDSASSVTKDVTLGKLDNAEVTVEWASNNAAISKEGKVTRGDEDVNVKLTATLTYKEKTGSKEFTLTVKAKEVEIVAPLAVEVSGNKQLTIGEEYTFTAVVKPDDATEKGVTWASDNEAVATVDASGKVKAIAAGEATITATAKGDETVKGTFKVTVVEPSAETIAKTIAKETGAEGWVKGTVVGVYAQGYMLYDGTGYILVYLGKDAQFNQTMGSYVEVKGVLGEYKGAKQFTKDATITALEEGEDYKINAVSADNAAVKALMENVEYGKKIKVRVSITSASASFVNAVVKDGDAGIAICYPLNYEDFEVGADYDITALAMYANTYNEVTSLYVMLEKAVKVDYGFEVTITYVDGQTKDEVKINSLQFPLDELKEPEAKEGYVFLGWYKGSAEAPVRVFELLTPEDITLTAYWVLEAEAPLIVNPEAEEGSGQYATIKEALEAATEGQVIMLLPGDYTEEFEEVQKADDGTETTVTKRLLTIDKKVTIVGPNANIAGYSDERGAEANILAKTEITAEGVLIQGVAFLEEGTVGLGADNITIKDCYFDTDKFINYNADNRKGSIANFDKKVTGFKVLNTFFSTPGTSYLNVAIAINGQGLEDTVIDNCRFESENSDACAYELIMAYRLYGSLTITNNYFLFGGTASTLRLGLYAAQMTEVVINNNVFSGIGDVAGGRINFEKLQDNGATLEFIHNQFLNWGGTDRQINIVGGASCAVTMMFNYFDDKQEFNIAVAPTTFKFDYNYVAGQVNDSAAAKPDAQEHKMESLEALEAAYKEFLLSKYEREYEDLAAIAAAYIADFNATTGLNITAAELDSNYMAANKMLAMLRDAAMTEKWGWLYKALATVAEKPEMDPAVVDATDGNTAVAGFYLTNLNALFTKTKHTDKWIETVSVDFTVDANVQAVYDASPLVPKKEAATITFVTEGAGDLEPIDFKNPAAVKLPTPEKKGYTFDGWYEGETKVAAIKELRNYELVAKWSVNKTLYVDPADETKFATIMEAMMIAEDGCTIEVAAGTYTEDVRVIKSVKFVGPNAGKAGKDESRGAEAIIDGIISFGADGVVFDGFTTNKQNNVFDGVNGLQFVNNIANNPVAGEGVLNAGAATSVKNILVANNYSKDYKGNRWVRFGTVENVVLKDNEVIGDGLFDMFYVDTCLFGEAELVGNYLEKANESFMYVCGVGGLTFLVKDNYIKDSAKEAIDTRFMVEAHAGNVVINVIHNTFDQAGSYDWRCIRPRNASYGDYTLDVQVHYNKFLAGAYSLIDGKKSYADNPAVAGAIFNMDNNYFADVLAAEVSNDNFSGYATSWANCYDSVEALEEAYKNLDTWYKIKFDADGADEIADVEFKSLEGIELPIPEKEGYAFAGWYEDGALVEEITELKDYNLKAKWDKIYTITLDTDGGLFKDFLAVVSSFGYAKSYWASANYPDTLWLITKDQAAGQNYSWSYRWGLSYDVEKGAFKVEEILPANGTVQSKDITWNYHLMCNAAFESLYVLEFLEVGDYLVFDEDILSLSEAAEVDFNMYGALFEASYETSTLPFEDLEYFVPEKAGFAFVGWYNGETKVEKITVAEDVTLKAKWVVPTVIEATEEELKIFAEGAPSIIVKAGLTDGVYTFVNGTYIFGKNAFATIDDAVLAAPDFSIVYLFAGEYNLTKKLTSEAIFFIGPNALKLGYAEDRVAEAKIIVEKDTQNWKGILSFTGLTVYGLGGAGATGTTFNATKDSEMMVMTNCILGNTNSYIKDRVASDTVYMITGCLIDNVGQFFMWFSDGGGSGIIMYDNYIDGESCGKVVNAAAALIRLRSDVNFAFIHNVVKGNPASIAGYFETQIGEAEAIILYNQFIDVTNYVYTPSGATTVGQYGFNYYINGETVATVSPISDSNLTPDSVVFATVDELEAAYKEATAKHLYDDVDDLAKDYMADFNKVNGKNLTAEELDTASLESSYMTAMLSNAEMNEKWHWLYEALATAAGDDSMDPDTIDPTSGDVKGFYLANLYGLFNQCQHTDTYLEKTSADFSNEDLVLQVLYSSPIVDVE